jgi:GntR family transcriptional regulator
LQEGGRGLNIIISNSSPDPIYLQIVNQIKSLILKGDLIEGELLPSIRNLAKELQISVITTKRAYEDLEREHLIQTVQGKGSYVAAQNKELMREKQLRVLEEQLILAIETGKLLGLSSEELQEMLQLLYEEV